MTLNIKQANNAADANGRTSWSRTRWFCTTFPTWGTKYWVSTLFYILVEMAGLDSISLAFPYNLIPKTIQHRGSTGR